MHRNADWSNGPFHIGCGKLVEKFIFDIAGVNIKVLSHDQGPSAIDFLKEAPDFKIYSPVVFI